MARRARGAAALVLAGVLLLLAGLGARMLLAARQELWRAAAAASRGDAEGQRRHLRRAMAHYLPGNPWVRRARDRLLHLARQAEARGRAREALLAWRELRGAILRLRGLTRPFAATLPEANARIAALSAGGAPRVLRRLERPPDPHPGWAGLGLVGLALWVGGALLLLYRGLRPDASVVARRFWPLLLVVALGLSLFGLGMGLA
jgi:hypothetical protein